VSGDKEKLEEQRMHRGEVARTKKSQRAIRSKKKNLRVKVGGHRWGGSGKRADCSGGSRERVIYRVERIDGTLKSK